MMENEQLAMAKLGLDVVGTERILQERNVTGTIVRQHSTTEYTVRVREDTFGPMIRLIQITDMIAESKNPQIAEQFEHLVTMLFLTEEKK